MPCSHFVFRAARETPVKFCQISCPVDAGSAKAMEPCKVFRFILKTRMKSSLKFKQLSQVFCTFRVHLSVPASSHIFHTNMIKHGHSLNIPRSLPGTDRHLLATSCHAFLSFQLASGCSTQADITVSRRARDLMCVHARPTERPDVACLVMGTAFHQTLKALSRLL